MWFPNRSDTNRAEQAQKMARDWKFWIKKVEELYYQCSENKGADQLRIVFAYADCWFSYENKKNTYMYTPAYPSFII